MAGMEDRKQDRGRLFGRVYKAQRTEKGRSFYSAIKIITIPASKGELDSVRSESGDEKSVRGYFENLVEECIQEVSTMEYFREIPILYL